MLRGDLITLQKCLEGGCSTCQSLLTSNETEQEDMAASCTGEGLDYISGKKIFTERDVKLWNRLPGK